MRLTAPIFLDLQKLLCATAPVANGERENGPQCVLLTYPLTQSFASNVHFSIQLYSNVGFLYLFFALCSALCHVVWVVLNGRWCVWTTTSRWMSLFATWMRSPAQSKSVLQPHATQPTSSGLITSPISLLTLAIIQATVPGTFLQQTTSGGLGPGVQYVP